MPREVCLVDRLTYWVSAKPSCSCSRYFRNRVADIAHASAQGSCSHCQDLQHRLHQASGPRLGQLEASYALMPPRAHYQPVCILIRLTTHLNYRQLTYHSTNYQTRETDAHTF